MSRANANADDRARPDSAVLSHGQAGTTLTTKRNGVKWRVAVSEFTECVIGAEFTATSFARLAGLILFQIHAGQALGGSLSSPAICDSRGMQEAHSISVLLSWPDTMTCTPRR